MVLVGCLVIEFHFSFHQICASHRTKDNRNAFMPKQMIRSGDIHFHIVSNNVCPHYKPNGGRHWLVWRVIIISYSYQQHFIRAIKFFSKRSLDLFAYYLRDSCTNQINTMCSFGLCSGIDENGRKGFRRFNPISLKIFSEKKKNRLLDWKMA